VETAEQKVPEYVYRALGEIYYGGGYDHRHIERFARRCGGVDIETLERVLRERAGEDKIIAIYALGYAHAPHVQQLLAPLLQSPISLEREASAIALGRLKDERALPALYSLLQAPFPDPDAAIDDEFLSMMSARMTIAAILGDWGKLSSTSVLRSALKAIWQWEQQRVANPLIHDELIVSPWQAYEYELSYALGQLGAFGALTGIPLSNSRERILMVFLALGHLQARQRYHDLFTQMSHRAVQEEVTKVLEDRFGLSETERDTCIKQFGSDYLWEGALERHPSPLDEAGEED
jgi:hypothetical protein